MLCVAVLCVTALILSVAVLITFSVGSVPDALNHSRIREFRGADSVKLLQQLLIHHEL